MPPADPATAPPRVPWSSWLLVATIVALAVAGVAWAAGHGEDVAMDAEASMLAVSPGGTVELASLSTDLQDLYHAVAGDEHGTRAVRCYCGCEQMLGHEDLFACFVRPDGMWERHAVGCAVCHAEARQVLADRADGVPIDRIVAEIDATYGSITAPQEADA